MTTMLKSQLDESSRRRQRPVAGWGSLTDGELRVARIVACGYTNAETADELYLSRHTVDFHLRHIYEKLAIRSRVQLVRWVLEYDGVTGAG